MDLFNGDIGFMEVITCLAVVIALLISRSILFLLRKDEGSLSLLLKNNQYVKSLSIFTLVVGVLGQLIGLFQAFEVLSEAGGASMHIMKSGLLSSATTTFYGLFIFILARLFVFIASLIIKKRRST